MKLSLVVAFASLALPLGFGLPFWQDSGQEGGEQEQEKGQEGAEEKEKLSPVTRFYREEQERLSKGIEGSWILMTYHDPDGAIGEDVLSGFATFHAGFLTLMIQAAGVRARFLRQVAQQYYVQAGSHRYRIDPLGFLQTSTVMGFSNSFDDFEVFPEPAGFTREYSIELTEAELALRRPDGTILTFRRVEAGEFPVEAIEQIEGKRGRAGQDY